MSSKSQVWYGRVDEDFPFHVLARVCSLVGTGDEVSPGEGNVVKQADVSSITCKVYDLGTNRDATTGTEVTPAPTLTPAANIYDTLRTTGWYTDRKGYNFRHDVGATYTGDPEEWRLLEYKFTFSDGGTASLKVRVSCAGVVT